MNKNNKMISWLMIFQLLMIFGIYDANAQLPTPSDKVEVSDEELENFVSLSSELQMQQQEIQTRMLAVIEESGMSMDKYTEITQSVQSGKQDGVSEADKKAFDELNTKLQPLQMQAQEEAVKLIEASEMEVTRFQTIAAALQTDQGLQQRYMALLQSQNE